MKALSTTILIAVTAVVILVVALVVLMIFTRGTADANAFVAFKNNCLTQCSLTCKMNSMPPTWSMKAYVPSLNKDTSCDEETKIKDCTGCGGTSTTGGTPNCPTGQISCYGPSGTFSKCATTCTGGAI